MCGGEICMEICMEIFEMDYSVSDAEAIERVKAAIHDNLQIIKESENEFVVIPKPVPSAVITVKDGKITVNGLIFGGATANACQSLLNSEFSK